MPIVRTLVAAAAFAAIMVVPRAGVGAQGRDPALEGVWRFVSEIDRRADGSIVRTGPDEGYRGLLIFTANGYMSSTLMPKGRTWRRDRVTPDELRATFEGASAHAGRYIADASKHVVRMENFVAIDPGDEGNWDEVRYRAEGDTLELSGSWTYEGEKLTFTLRLERMK